MCLGVRLCQEQVTSKERGFIKGRVCSKQQKIFSLQGVLRFQLFFLLLNFASKLTNPLFFIRPKEIAGVILEERCKISPLSGVGHLQLKESSSRIGKNVGGTLRKAYLTTSSPEIFNSILWKELKSHTMSQTKAYVFYSHI